MPTESIIGTLLAAALVLKRPLQEIGAQSLRIAYELAAACLRKKISANPTAVDALDLAAEKPESSIRRALLLEESAGFDLAGDAELAGLIDRLSAMLPSQGAVSVHVTGERNRVQVAGRDFISVGKIIEKNTITPDERHLSSEQSAAVKTLIGRLAARLRGQAGPPNYAGAHHILQKGFQVASSLLIPREKFEEVRSFLKRQLAVYRTRLRRRDPVVYRNELFRGIFAGARELGWTGTKVYAFATEALGLKIEIDSLKRLETAQLETIAARLRSEVKRARPGSEE